jgi:hypothetical protein
MTLRPDGPRDSVTGPDSGPESPFPIKLSGPVITGFGRGSKEVRTILHFQYRSSRILPALHNGYLFPLCSYASLRLQVHRRTSPFLGFCYHPPPSSVSNSKPKIQLAYTFWTCMEIHWSMLHFDSEDRLTVE